MALRLGKNGAGLWLRMQRAYDLRHAERAMKAETAKRPTAKVKACPVSGTKRSAKRSAKRSCARLGQLLRRH
jgi:plasmid maintenance system antidote protein VapI